MSSGLIYLRNRYYAPNVGRFITEDPIRAGLNWYVYASNNPVNRIDPSGLLDSYVNVSSDSYLNVRENPSTSSKIVSQLTRGTKIDYIDTRKMTKADGLSWVQLRTGGWVAHDFLSAEAPASSSSSNSTSPLVAGAYKIPTGSPNSSEPLYDNNGNKIGERFYGPDGKATHDRDDTDHGNPKNHPNVPHVHDWGPERRGDERPVSEFAIDPNAVTTGVGIGVGIYAGYQIIKGIVAAGGAPFTGGQSLWLFAAP